MVGGLDLSAFRRDVSIFPINHTNKRPLISEWKHYQTAPPSEAEVQEWVEKLRPKAWAVVLGRVSGNMYVVDVDSPDAEATVVVKLLRGLFGPTYVVESSKGKRHFYYTDPTTTTLRNRGYRNEQYNDPTIPHTDLKGEGGYVLVPGSLHPSGSVYKAVEENPIAVVEYERVAFVLRTLNKHWPVVQAVKPYYTPGSRNQTCLGLAAYFHHHGFSEEEAILLVSALYTAIDDKGDLGKAQEDTSRTYENAKNGMNVSFREFLPDTLVEDLGRLPRGAGYGSLDVDKTVDDFLSKHNIEPPETPPPGEGTVVVADKKEEDYMKIKGDFELTDLGNGERLVDNFDGRVRYCRLWKSWLLWDGTRWRKDDKLEIRLMAYKTARLIVQEAMAAGTKKEANKILKWAEASESKARIDAMLGQADALVPVTPDQLDKDPWLLNVKNGTIDLRSGKLVPHDPENNLTKLAPVEYDPAAACPAFTRYLAEVMPDSENRKHLQMWLGYSLTGDMGEKAFRIDWGPTKDNGKSTLYRVVKAMLGDYAATVTFDTLLERDKPHTPKNDLAALQGKRLVMATESKSSGKMDVATIKAITGNDPIHCRFLFAEFFEYQPTFKIWLMGNEKPNIDDSGEAIWSRVHLVHWPVQIPRSRQDKELDRKLVAEASGILNWALEGLSEWRRLRNIVKPPEVDRATQEYMLESDWLNEFLADYFETDSSAEIPFGKIMPLYQVWAQTQGRHPVGPKRLGAKLQARFRKKLVDGYPVYCGLRTKA